MEAVEPAEFGQLGDGVGLEEVASGLGVLEGTHDAEDAKVWSSRLWHWRVMSAASTTARMGAKKTSLRSRRISGGGPSSAAAQRGAVERSVAPESRLFMAR